MKLKKYFWIGLLILLFASCSKPVQTELKREDKFTLNYGSFENELNLFNLSSPYTRTNTQIFMKDGLFYIANSGGQKILKTSSFGDLLSLYYNPETNIKPSLPNSDKGEEKNSSTTKSIEYPFNHPCNLIVTGTKQLFVVDSVDEDKIEYDHEEELALRNVILQFDEQGNFIDYIGQEGLRGIPFPTINGIYTNSQNDLIVMCRTQKGITIYWYNKNLALLYKMPIFFEAVPHPYETDVRISSSVDKVVPAFDKHLLYVKIDYYIEKKDPSTGVSLGVDYDKSYLYFLNIQTGKYEKKIEIEPYEGKEIADGKELSYKKVYGLMGVTKNNWCYLYTPIDDAYALLLIDLSSRTRYKKLLSVKNYEMLYNAFNLSPDGIISAILAQEDKAVVSWWRVDEIIGER